jgi:hypothetical protein
MKVGDIVDRGVLKSVRGIKVRGRASVDDVVNKECGIDRKENEDKNKDCLEYPLSQAPLPAVLQSPEYGITKCES